MAALVFETGVESHPQIKITLVDLEREEVTFQWVGGPHGGDCSESFTVSLEEHGETTVNGMVALISAEMIARLPSEE